MMNKLYILGALALATADAAISLPISPVAFPFPTTGIWGSYTYTVTADCFATGTATSLGMNNIYHQYYSFKLAKGTSTFATATYTYTTLPAIPVAVTYTAHTTEFKGCYHSHLYNWMAQPQIAASSNIGGFGNSMVAYGYAMTGTAVTSCAALSYATALYASSKFTGAQFQSVSATFKPAAAEATSVWATANMWGRVGPMYYYAKSGTTAAFTTITNTGLILAASQAAYWDFQQTNTVMGMTQFGRGGGASTAPCGWWVVYTYEAPKAGQTADADALNVDITNDEVTINMWTDNSVIKAASAFVLTALAGLLF